MCMNVGTTVATHKGQRKVWKILKVLDSSIQDPILRSLYYDHNWHPGVNESGRTCLHQNRLELLVQVVGDGFHVYTSESETKKKCTALRSVYSCTLLLVIELTVDSSDFVAEDPRTHQAVYTKVTLSEEEFTKAMSLEPV